MNYGEEKQRTGQQNKSIHVDCKLISDALNLAGLEMKLVLRGDTQIWWTPEAVKEYLWRPVQKMKYQKESTTELSKNGGEINEIHEQIMHILGERHHLEYFPFPHDEEKEKEKQYITSKSKVEYPDGNSKTAFD